MQREWVRTGMDSRCKGVVAGIKHTLGVVVREGVSLDAQVAEHGIRLPAAKELDGILGDVGAERRTVERGVGPDRG